MTMILPSASSAEQAYGRAVDMAGPGVHCIVVGSKIEVGAPWRFKCPPITMALPSGSRALVGPAISAGSAGPAAQPIAPGPPSPWRPFSSLKNLLVSRGGFRYGRVGMF